MGSGPASPDSLAIGLYPGKPKNNCTAHAWVSPSPSPDRSWLSPVSGRFGGRRATAGCGRSRAAKHNSELPPVVRSNRGYLDWSPSRDFHQLLAEVLALQQADQRARRVVQAFDDRFAVLEPSLGNVSREARQRLAVAILPVEHDHSLHPDAVHEHRAQPLVAVRLLRAVLGDQAAEDDARVAVHQPERGIEHCAADILEIDVDAVRTCGAKIVVQIPRAVIDAGVEAELVNDVVALGPAARDADGATAADLRELADDAANGARRRGDDDRLSGPWLPDLEQAEPRGESRHAENAEVVRSRDVACVDLRHVGAVCDAVALPAQLRQHLVTDAYARVARVDHFAD